MTDLKIIILAENYAYKALHSEAGFSACIEHDKTKILFDAGLTGTCVIRNAGDLGVKLDDIERIVISHGHYDHTDGLEEVLRRTGPKTIIAHPDIFKNRFSQKENRQVSSGIKNTRPYLESQLGAEFFFHDSFTEVAEKIYVTGVVPFTNEVEKIPEKFKERDGSGNMIQDTFEDENSLVFDTGRGLIVLSGCAHRGIVNICEYAAKKLKKSVYGIIGGFHLKEVSPERLDFVIKWIGDNDIQLIAPGHCTGIDNIFKLKSVFGSKVIPAFCGRRYDFNFT